MGHDALVTADQFVEGIILLKAFQYLFIAVGFTVSMLFMLLLAVTAPII